MNEWFIKIFRSLIDWEWYDDINTCRLFIHLLLKVNYIDTKWRWIEIKKWERLTSIWNLSSETGLSPMQVRYCIKKLKTTNEITIKTTNNYTLIKLNNYDKYNWDNIQVNKRVTNEQQTSNKRVTTNKEGKKGKKEKNILVTNMEEEISKEILPPKNKITFQDLLKENFNEDFINKLKVKYGITSEELKTETELFILYWTEKSPNWNKEKWEMEKTYEIQRRFYTWLAKNKKWSWSNLKSKKEITYG